MNRWMKRVKSMPGKCHNKSGTSCDYEIEYWDMPNKCRIDNLCTKNTMFIFKKDYKETKNCYNCKFEKEKEGFKRCMLCEHAIMFHDKTTRKKNNLNDHWTPK